MEVMESKEIRRGAADGNNGMGRGRQPHDR